MDQKKADMRQDKAAPTDNKTVRPGAAELADNIRPPRSEMHATAPDPGKHLAEGQVTKSN